MSRGPGSESCEGTVDEDCDGAIDEGCACTEGASRACTGPSEGACSAGAQSCRGGTWSACEGAVGPVAEVCGNGLDDDCDGVSDDPSFCSCSPVPEVCGNGVDDDCDGLSDESPCAAPTPDAGLQDGGLPDANMEPFDTGTRDDSGGVDDPIVEVAAGWQHSCARRASGMVLCWGANGQGQLGDGTTESRPTPGPVLGLTDAVELTVDSNHTCARRESGAVVCWGANSSGAIGDGTCTTVRSGCEVRRTGALSPTVVLGLTDAVQIAAGASHSCALRRDGSVVCWGENTEGQLGNGCSLGRDCPVALTEVVGLTDAVEVRAGGNHTCARQSSGRVVCWGTSGGAAGGGDEELIPVEVLGLVEAEELGLGAGHSCARRAGSVMCWGWNYFGQLGDGTTNSTGLTPTSVTGLPDAVELGSGGHGHACARRSDGGVVCWGRNDEGALGDDTVESRLTPAEVVELDGVTQLDCGLFHTCAVSAGRAWCWGQGSNGQLGDGTRTARYAPRMVRGL
jgi:hypothetical protein